MTTIWTKENKPKKPQDPDPALRPTAIFEIDYDTLDEQGVKVGPSYTIEWEATGMAWGADEDSTYGIRTLDELIDYLKDSASDEEIYDYSQPLSETRPMTVVELLESWDFKPVPSATALRIRLKEEG
jgi:hypothetical protein